MMTWQVTHPDARAATAARARGTSLPIEGALGGLRPKGFEPPAIQISAGADARDDASQGVQGIVMLLPQSPAYHTLKNRLSAVPEIGLLRLQLAQQYGASSRHGAGKLGGGRSIDFRALMRQYEELRTSHARA